jgi:hypothetical protein
MVEENGRLIRACAIAVADGMKISTKAAKAEAAQVEAFDRILSNHMLYCTVCDNNNGNCVVHNTTKLLAIEHQQIPFRTKSYEVDNTNPFYRYDPDQCILWAGASRHVRTSRLTKRFRSTGTTPIPVCSGTAGPPSESPAAFLAAIASRFAPAMLLWKKPCWAMPDS